MIYDISFKNLILSKPLRIRFNQIYGFIGVYDETRYLSLFGPENNDAIYNRIRYLLSLKTGIKHVFSQCYARIEDNS